MLEILFSWLSPFRFIGIWIDTIAYSLIDNAYNLIVTFSKGTLLKEEFIVSLMNNLYVVIGIFALFRIAMLLVNSIINPDKLSEKGNGLANVFGNFIIMFVMLVMTPFVFREAINLQTVIVDGNYIQKLFIKADAMEGKNPGKAMRSIAIGSLITLDEVALEQCEGGGTCSNNAKEAIEAYRDMEKNGFSFPTLSKYIGVSIKDDDTGEVVYVYNYMFLVTFAAGIFIAYVLFSFGIDIAVRMVELTVLQILAPLFIATYIDPKSAKSGTFHKWLTTVGKTYASLFIKLAILSLMLLLISIVSNLDYYGSNLELSGFEKLVLLFAILIFAKKAPKWIGDMVGVEGAGLGGLGIGKKLGGAALIGGAISKGRENAIKRVKDNTKKRANNFLDSKVAGIGARVAAYKNFKPDPSSTLSARKQRQLDAKEKSRAVQDRLRADQKAQNDFRVFATLRDKYAAGQKAVDPNSQSGREKKLNELNQRASESTRSAGIDASTMSKMIKDANDIKKAKALYGSAFDLVNNKLDKVKFPINTGQINTAYKDYLGHNPFTADEIRVAKFCADNGISVADARALNRDGTVKLANGKTLNRTDIINQVKSSESGYIKALYEQSAYENMMSSGTSYEQDVKLKADASKRVLDLIAAKDQIKAPVVPAIPTAPVFPSQPSNDATEEVKAAYQVAVQNYVKENTEYETAKAEYPEKLKEYEKAKAEYDKLTGKDGSYTKAIEEAQKTEKMYESSIKESENSHYDQIVYEVGRTNVSDTGNGNYIVSSTKKPDDFDKSVVNYNGEYITKFGKYVSTADGWEFKKQDMSQYMEFINGEQSKKKTDVYDKNVENAKPVEIKEQEGK